MIAEPRRGPPQIPGLLKNGGNLNMWIPMKNPTVILKKGKDKAVRNRHHWIFSGAVASMPDFEDGDLLAVQSSDGEFLGTAYFNRKCSIIGRMVSFGRTPAHEALAANICRAVSMREVFFNGSTNAYRLIHGEGDGIPGLVADRYKDVLVIQVSTLGMEKLKPFVLDVLGQVFPARSVYEKSHGPARREEGLPQFEGWLRGEPAETVEILESGVRFIIDIVGSQKTGFYLDQREMRGFARSLAKHRTVLNAFAYTGSFTVFALKGGALRADSVDISAPAIALARENCLLNGLESPENRFLVADVFDFIRDSSLDYDFVILDPPAFAKKKNEVVKACRGYKDIHRIVFEKIRKGSLIMTFSCSHFVDERLFQQVIFQAAAEASRSLRLLQRHRQAFDHPINIYHPESDYLKGFLLYLE
jgi:23S rRNA (cytosine1962-C5)-methyltransferase